MRLDLFYQKNYSYFDYLLIKTGVIVERKKIMFC